MKLKRAFLFSLFVIAAVAIFSQTVYVNLFVLNGTYFPPATVPGEMTLPYSDGLVSRYIATRSDGLHAYCYGDTNGAHRTAFFYHTNTVNIPSHPYRNMSVDFTYGTECAWVGNDLFVGGSRGVGSNPSFAEIHHFTVSANTWPPTVITNGITSFSLSSNVIRWPRICSLENGGVVATWWRQDDTFNKIALVAYRTPGGTWSTNFIDFWGGIGGYAPGNQSAGEVQPIQHPVNKLVYIHGLQDGRQIFTAAVMQADAGSLTLVSNVVFSDGYPVGDTYDPHAFHSEFPQNYKVWQQDGALRVLGNAREPLTTPQGQFVTYLVMYDIYSNNALSTVRFSSNWTERAHINYGYLDDYFWMMPVGTNYGDPVITTQGWLVKDGGTNDVRLHLWSYNHENTGLAQGTNCVAYTKSNETAVVYLIP